jgi:hypothetical protein
MPACFQLIPIGSDEPARFAEIDDAMCAHFGVTPDESRYYQQWYDIEGFGCAMGKTWAELRTLMPERAPIIDWLEQHYTCDSWTEIGRR